MQYSLDYAIRTTDTIRIHQSLPPSPYYSMYSSKLSRWPWTSRHWHGTDPAGAK